MTNKIEKWEVFIQGPLSDEEAIEEVINRELCPECANDKEYLEEVKYREAEISVILKNNKHGHSSYGWGGEDKIIIGEYIGGKESFEFFKHCAKILCDGLNREENK
jgi:hypothetical protein